MIKYLTFLLFISFSAFANPITLITNGTSTGTNGQQIKIISDFFEKEGFKTEIKITNHNCALAKLLWDSSQTKTFMLFADGVDGLSDSENISCYIEPKKENIFFWLYSSPYFFCSVGNKTWNDLIKPNTTSIIAIHVENKSMKFIDFLSKTYNNKLKVVKINNSSDVLTMAKANEIDFVFRSGIFDLDIFKNKCEWSSIQINGLPNFQMISGFEIKESFAANGYIISKNINDGEKNIFVEILKKAANSNDMMKINQRRNYDPSLVSFSSESEYKTKINELYKQITD